jgi:hypothetical protein
MTVFRAGFDEQPRLCECNEISLPRKAGVTAQSALLDRGGLRILRRSASQMLTVFTH